MKYLGILAFLLALLWSRSLIMSPSAVSLETHTAIQEQLIEMITQSVANHRPEGVEVRFDHVWTEPLSDKRLKAVYRYTIVSVRENGRFDTETITGNAMLDLTEDGSWLVHKITTTNKEIDFQTGVLLRPENR